MTDRVKALIPFIAAKLAEQSARSGYRTETDSGCYYTCDKGHCAVGHLMTPEVQQEVGAFLGSVVPLLENYPHALANVLPGEITDREIRALTLIQEYHDDGDYEAAYEATTGVALEELITHELSFLMYRV